MESKFYCREDEQEFYKAFGDILNLFGIVDKDKIARAFLKRFDYVKSHPKGFQNEKVNAKTPGKSGYSAGINEKMFMEFIGMAGCDSKAITQHYIRHELTHIFETVAHDVLSSDSKGKINELGIPIFVPKNINNRKYTVIEGTIYRQIANGENENKIYGAGFCELFTDMIAIFSKVNSDEKYKQQVISVDTVLRHPIKDWNNVEGITSGYMKALPILRLMIAAFSNLADTNYQKLIESGNGILFETNKDTGERKIVNDFIYGSLCDPFYMMNECDKIVGREGYYFYLCDLVDRIVNNCVDNHSIDMQDVEEFIGELNGIVSKRIQMKCSEGVMTIEKGISILKDYEKIRNSVREELNPSLQKRR